MKKPRMYISIGIAVAVILAVALIPLPHSIMATLEVQPRDAQQVYISVAEGGRLAVLRVKKGDEVTKGQVLAELESHDLDIEISKLKAKEDLYRIQLENLRRQGAHDHRATSEVPQIEEALNAVQKQLQQKSEDLKRLRLTAQRDGTVLPPPITPPPRREDPDGQLPGWTGTPLDPQNIGTYLKEGVLFCQIGDPRQLEAIAVVDQTDIEFVREGQKVDLKFDELPHDTLEGQIDRISVSNLRITPQRLSTKAGGDLSSTTDPTTGVERPQSTSYQARIPLDDEEGVLRLGLRGRAKIHAEWVSIGFRLWRFVTHTFNFKL